MVENGNMQRVNVPDDCDNVCFRCRGAITKCIKASLGCTFQGPRSALQSHLWECHYRDQQSGMINAIFLMGL